MSLTHKVIPTRLPGVGRIDIHWPRRWLPVRRVRLVVRPADGGRKLTIRPANPFATARRLAACESRAELRRIATWAGGR